MSLKIERYTDTPIISYDYKTILNTPLDYKEEVKGGFIVKELYYHGEELITEVTNDYVKNPDTGVAYKVIKTIKYIAETGDDLVLSREKKLTPRQQMKLLKTRRKTVRANCEAVVLYILQAAMSDKTKAEVMAIGAAFLLKYDTPLDHYEKVGSPSIIQALQTADEEWLDIKPPQMGGATLRQYLMSEFSS